MDGWMDSWVDCATGAVKGRGGAVNSPTEIILLKVK